MKFHIEIDADICKGCGLCIPECSKNVIELGDKFNKFSWRYAIPARNNDCIGCKRCAIVCPEIAIKVIKEDD